MELSSVVAGGLMMAVSGLYLLYGFRFGTILLLSRGAGGGMKDRKTQSGWFWLAVVEWSALMAAGGLAMAIGLLPNLRAWIRG